MIRVEEVSDLSQLAAYREHWNELVERSPDASMFDAYEWLTSWIEAFWENRPLRFLLFWNKDVLQGIAPLLLDEGNVWCGSSLVCPVNLHGNRASVICAEDPAAIYEALIAHLRQSTKRWRVAFRNVLATSPLSSTLPAIAAKAGMSSRVIPSISSPIIRISGDWQSYLKSRSSHLAKEVKRKVKQFQAAGRVEIAVVSRADQCRQAIQDILHIEKRSWKAEQGVALDRVPGLQRLYESFANAASAKGLLRSYLLYLDSKPVGYVYGAAFHNEYYALRTSYDVTCGKLSPGIVLFDRILREAFEEGMKFVDFGPGDDSRWKHDFANDVREQVNVCVFSPWSLQCHSCSLIRQRVMPIIKKHPALVKLKNKIHPSV